MCYNIKLWNIFQKRSNSIEFQFLSRMSTKWNSQLWTKVTKRIALRRCYSVITKPFLPNPRSRCPHGVDPGAHGCCVHSPRQLYPGRAVVAFHQVHEVQKQYESNGDVGVTDVAGWLANCAFYRESEGQVTDLGVRPVRCWWTKGKEGVMMKRRILRKPIQIC